MVHTHSPSKDITVLFVFLACLAMAPLGKTADMLQIDNAQIFYETAGQGAPILFIHAGVADSRQWNNEFQTFKENHRVIRYDMRGFGRSDPAEGEFSHLEDLTKLLEHLNIAEPIILVGCSMGGSTALNYALTNPKRVKALVLVDSAPSGLDVDVPIPPKFQLAEEAAERGDLELVSEIETQIWFDGDRPTERVDQTMRQLAYEMNLIALTNSAKGLGAQQPNTKTPSVKRLAELQVPTLAIVGENDIPYMHAAVDVMSTKVADFRQVIIENAGHLPNMDQPKKFEEILRAFIQETTNRR